MKLRRFCAKCGQEITANDPIFEGFLCGECAGKETSAYPLPETLQLRQCVFCQAFSLRDPTTDHEYEWGYQPKDESDVDYITRLLYEYIFFHLEQKHNLVYDLFFPQDLSIAQDADIQIRVEVVGGTDLRLENEPKQVHSGKSEENISQIPIQNYQEGIINLRLRRIHCPHCAKRQGGRFDAIVQIRIQHDRDQSRLPQIMADIQAIDHSANIEHLQNFITHTEQTTNGYDLKVSTNAMARVIISRLRELYPFEIKHSKRLMGIDPENGSRLYRHSTLLRLVPVLRDDRITLDGVSYRVHNLTKKKVILQEIQNEKMHHVNFDIFQKKKWFFFDD